MLKKDLYKVVCLLLVLCLMLSSCAVLRPQENEADEPQHADEETEQNTDGPEQDEPTEPKVPKVPEVPDEPTEPTGPVEPTEPEEPDTAAIAAEIVGAMTLEEKIGQMLMPSARTWTDAGGVTGGLVSLNDSLAAALRELGLGGVILFSDNTAGTAATAGLIYDMQEAASADGGIPLFISVDQEGGYIVRLGTGTGFCGNMALGATGDAEYAREAASVIGKELSALGFNVDFAPVLDVNNNPSNPIIGVRSFSDDPQMTAEFGKAFVAGLHEANVAAALKHFPGHGDTATDSHSGLPCIDKPLDELMENELVPFAAAIENGADFVMTAHIQYPQIETETYASVATGEAITLPATLSHTIITDVLRGTLGFDGVVCTDALNMGAITEHFAPNDAARLAINAGVDMLLMPVDLSSDAGIERCRTYIANIVGMVNSGEIDEQTITAAAERIIRLKVERGIIDTDGGVKASRSDVVDNALSAVGSAGNHETEWEIAKAAVTLVKNDGALPMDLSNGGSAVVLCPYENELKSVQYAVSRLKADGVIAEDASVTALCYQNCSAYDFTDHIVSSDSVIVLSEAYGAADVSGGWQTGFIDTLTSITHRNAKKITVISVQLPYDLARYGEADALLAAYNSKGMNVMPNTYDGETQTYGVNIPAAVYAAFGGCVPCGKLPVGIPALSQWGGFSDEMLYPRGFGLENREK